MTDWTLTLTGGPRHGDRIATPDLLPFLKFTTGAEDGTTTDHYYAPTQSNQSEMTAVYEPADSPDAAVAQIWEQGLKHALDWYGHSTVYDVMAKDNPYRRRT
jgi:hypothetical protein